MIIDAKNIKEILTISKQTPNDMEFGKKLRELIKEDSFKLIPNDGDLGKKIRKSLNGFSFQ